MIEPLYRSTNDSWHGHQSFAIELVSQMKPRNFVELGVQWGDSYFAFCQGIHQYDVPCWTFGIDTWRGDEHSGNYGEEVFETATQYNQEHYSDFSLLIRSTFTEARPRFQDRSVDLLHIDGHHTYESVKHDFTEWFYTLSSRAIVLFHDTAVPYFGIGQFFEEQCAKFPHFAFSHNNGLGILAVGKKVNMSKLSDLYSQFSLAES